MRPHPNKYTTKRPLRQHRHRDPSLSVLHRALEQWLKQVARSKCKAFLVDAKKRSLLREAADEHYAGVAEQEASAPMRQYHLHERVCEVWEIVEGMESIYVKVFELWELGLTEAESTKVLKTLQNTVKSRRNKIRKVVREKLGVSLTSKKRK